MTGDAPAAFADAATWYEERRRRLVPSFDTFYKAAVEGVLLGRQPCLADLRDPFPDGPFDAVVSALAIHHLGDDDKRELFRRVKDCLEPVWCFHQRRVGARAYSSASKIRWSGCATPALSTSTASSRCGALRSSLPF
jgi:hypothetical protein